VKLKTIVGIHERIIHLYCFTICFGVLFSAFLVFVGLIAFDLYCILTDDFHHDFYMTNNKYVVTKHL